MSIVLPALPVAFATFCVWLGVRIFNRRERWAKWTAAGLVAGIIASPVIYFLAVGPALALYMAGVLGEKAWDNFQYPIVLLGYYGAIPGSLCDWYASYLEWWARQGALRAVP
jgi:hypothetical protein